MKKKKLFYSTGMKINISLWDIIKFKLRLGDYDDTHGVRSFRRRIIGEIKND